jgi:hypothetical protein
MEKMLLKEINQFKLLTDYDTKKTLTENKFNINEGIGDEIKALITAFKTSKTLKNEILKFLSKGVKDESDNLIKTVDDLEYAISIGHVSEQTIKDLKTHLLNTSKDVNIVNTLIKNAVTSTEFIAKYSKLTAAEAATELAKKGYSPETVKKIMKGFTDNGGKFKIVSEVFENIKNQIKQDKAAVGVYSKLTSVEKTEFKEYVTAHIHSGKEFDDVLSIAESWISSKGSSQFQKKYAKKLKKWITLKKIGIGAALLIVWALATNKLQIIDLLKKGYYMFFDETEGKESSTDNGTKPDNGGGNDGKTLIGYKPDGTPVYQ